MTQDEFNSAVLRELAAMRTLLQRMAPAAKAAPVGEVASDADLDGQYGNPEVRKNPPRWKGSDFVGRKYSECSPEYLDEMASFLNWKEGKDAEKGTPEGDKYAGYARIDARRARGWAARIRAGGVTAPTARLALARQPAPDFGAPDESDVPF